MSSMAKRPAPLPDFLTDDPRGGKIVQLLDGARHLFLEHASATARGLLTVPDPKLAAAQFLALTKSDMHLRCLLEPAFLANPIDIERNVDAAVAMFMSHYGPHPR